jgi:pimeloyl-ACP methyl ester carboxylesterase
VRLHAEVDGPPDGAPVVFLHGVSGSTLTYAWLTGAITEGRRIVRLDLRGHGRSEHAPGTYVVDRYGEDVVEALRETVGRPAVLVGHSLGGVVAWWVAQHHPELVAAAFLEDPPLYMGEPDAHEDNGAVPIFGAILAAVGRWKAQGMTAEQAGAELAAAPTAAALCDDVPLARAEALLRMDPGVLEGAIDGSTLAPTDTASPVSVPVFLLAADFTGSAFAAHHAERLAISHPDVEIVRVPGAGHGIHDEREHRGDYVEALARFLATHA